MKKAAYSFLLLGLIAGLPAQGFSAESDTREQRLAAAKEYHELSRFKENLINPPAPVVRPTQVVIPGEPPEAKKRREEQQAAFFEEERKARGNWDLKMLEEASLNALADTFTAKELTAINTFLKSPEGRAYREKMREYSEKYGPIQSQEREKHRPKPARVTPVSVPPSAPPAKK